MSVVQRLLPSASAGSRNRLSIEPPSGRSIAPLVFGCALSIIALSPAHAGDAASTRAVENPDRAGSVSDSRRGNICFGGLDDGKLIPSDDRIDNPFRQTTLLGCSVEGGEPVYLPDLAPAIANGVMA